MINLDNNGNHHNLDKIYNQLSLYLESKIYERDKLLMNTKEVSELLGVSQRTIANYRKKQQIPFIRIGRNIRYERRKIMEMIYKNQSNPKGVKFNDRLDTDKLWHFMTTEIHDGR